MTEILIFTARRQLFQMCFALACFHCFEYVLAITIHGKNSVTLKSLLISKSYVMAMICSMIENFVEIYFCPRLKEYRILSDIGLAMVVVGEIIRKSAIITGGRSFTHLIKMYHEEHHVLVNHGVFKYLRHPSYCGFLIWSVGTQLLAEFRKARRAVASQNARVKKWSTSRGHFRLNVDAGDKDQFGK